MHILSPDDPPEPVAELFRHAVRQLGWSILYLEDGQHAVSFPSRALAQRLAPGSVIALRAASGKEYYAAIGKSAIKTVNSTFKFCILGEEEHAARVPPAKSAVTHKTTDWFHKHYTKALLGCIATRLDEDELDFTFINKEAPPIFYQSPEAALNAIKEPGASLWASVLSEKETACCSSSRYSKVQPS